jgi:hypothetical protein
MNKTKLKRTEIYEYEHNKTYNALRGIIDNTLWFKTFADFLAEDCGADEFKFDYANFTTITNRINTFQKLMIESLMEKYNCNENGEYHKRSLYGYHDIKCKRFYLDKERVKYIATLFFQLANTLPETTNYIIFKQENN